MKGKWLLSSAALLVSPLNAIFTDDAFHLDYHQALLGIPQSHATFFHKPQSSSNASLLYTISDKAVLGAVKPRDGSIVWRQILADQPIETADETFLVAGDADGRVTSAFRSDVSSWDAFDGRLNWAHAFEAGSFVKGLQTVPTVVQGAENIIQDIIALAGPGTDGAAASVVRFAGDGSATRWEYQDKTVGRDTSYSVATSPKHVYYVTRSSGLLSGSKARVIVIDITNGKELSQYNVAVDSDPLGPGNSLSIGSGSETPCLLSAEKPYKSIKFNLLGSNKVSTLNIDDKGDEVEKLTVFRAGGPNAAPHFLVHVQGKTKQWAEVFHINAKNGDVKKAYSLPATAETSTFTATAVGSAVYFTRITDTEVSLYSSESHGHVGRWPRSIVDIQTASQTSHATAEISSKGANAFAVRVAYTSTTTGWSLIRNGEQSWNRPEALAYVTRAIWSDDVVSPSLAREIEVEAKSNPITAYVHRVSRHVQALRHLPQSLLNIPASILRSGDDGGETTRQKLIGSRLILASTSRGEIIALDATKAGAVRWSTKFLTAGASNEQAVHLSVERGRLTVYLTDGQFIVIDVTNGKVIERQTSSTPFHKVIELPGLPANTIVRVSSDGKPEVFSELAPAVPTEGSVLVTINEKGGATGWSVGSSVEQIWTLQPEKDAKMTGVIARSLHDPLSSIGQVLGDRSVLYKYINPNVALLTALSSTALTVYVVNAITGAVLHTATHNGVLSELPVSATASGNKFAYCFATRDPTTSGLSSQIVVAELYESENPNDRGLLAAQANYSSFSPDAGAKPYVLSQAFTVAEPLSQLAVSQTTQGIASRQILAYLANAHSILGIPSDALNARRPVGRDPTPTEMEEGLTRYHPILELDSKFFLSHNLDVVGIEKIMTAPTLLESTSLVFAYGHDIFGTQVAPSNTFDVLGKSFKRIQLILTVVALYAGVLAIRPIARSKIVKQRWL